ncbi:Extracellular metalloprotease [Purpureocillium lavendulum]|uniref:Extracellular metalloprotease n=1 Tax=Purpureocillium lavendulum TaxID=1247861 RepID=A0AB34FGR8_9HYPO|nr:Extracellular metalloprotease [Purpureocillium lavendulum]
MSFDTVFWFASCTKLITAIAAMQLVEQGKLSLDSKEDVQLYLPELSQVKVLEEDKDGNLKLVEQQRRITLRMLLSHTAGFGYSFSNEKLKKWYDPIGIDEFDNQECDVFAQPLVNQPGTTWEYGVNIDWAGRLVERVSGLSLDDYSRLRIFMPMNLSRLTFFPTAEMRERLAYVHRRNEDGSITINERGHPLRRPLAISTAEEIRATASSGGAGLFGSPVEYCNILAMLLNLGRDPTTSKRILKEETVREMFVNQIPQFPDFARNLRPPCKPSLVNDADETYPQPGNPPQGWGLSFFSLLRRGTTGRAVGTAWWSGVANLIWWADLENGMAGMLASQILPFGDKEVSRCQADIEQELYKELLGSRM